MGGCYCGNFSFDFTSLFTCVLFAGVHSFILELTSERKPKPKPKQTQMVSLWTRNRPRLCLGRERKGLIARRKLGFHQSLLTLPIRELVDGKWKTMSYELLMCTLVILWSLFLSLFDTNQFSCFYAVIFEFFTWYSSLFFALQETQCYLPRELHQGFTCHI